VIRRIHLVAVVAGLALVLPLSATGAKPPSKPPPAGRIALPNGWQPEGIAIGSGNTFYVGSISTGRVWRGDLRNGRGSVLVPSRGRQATGVAVDHRNRLFVAGGASGEGYVYDPESGADIAQYHFAGGSTFVNDVVVTPTAAWFTDSFRKFLYKVPIAQNGRLGAAQAIRLKGAIVYTGGFNVNGIDATPDGKTLIIDQTNTGKLFTVTRRGVTRPIRLGGVTVPGDGILLRGRTLYTVVRSPADAVVVIGLRANLSSGTVLRTITDSGLDDPTAVEERGNSLYAVNARLSTPPGSDVEYWVTRLRR
jgi:hypothetical protein